MKARATRRHRLRAATPVRHPTPAQQEADFTAEGAPPPGKVALEPPALPATERDPQGAADDKD